MAEFWLFTLFKEMWIFLFEKLLWLLQWTLNRIAHHVRMLKHQARLELADLIRNKLNAIHLLLISAFAMVIFLVIFPALGTFVMVTGIAAFIEGAMSAVKTWTGLIGIRALIALNQIAMLVWPEYQKWMADVRTAAGALSAELGESSNYLLSFFRNARAMMYAADGMLGLGVDFSEARWAQGVTGFLSKWNDRFQRYSLDPSLIAYDIDHELIQPMLYDSRDRMAQLWGKFNMVWDNVSHIMDGVRNLWTAWQKMQTDLPPIIKEAWEERFSDINEKLGHLIDDVLTPFQDKVNAVIDIIQVEIDLTREQQEQLQEDFDSYLPFSSLLWKNKNIFDKELSILHLFLQRIFGDKNAEALHIARQRRLTAIETLDHLEDLM